MAKRILIVEDSDDIALVVKTTLTMRHYEVERASDGLEALNMARADSWDLVILDVLIPEIDGFEVLRRLKSDPETKHIKIALFTAHFTEQERQLSADLGADGVLVKPFDPRRFVEEIGALVADE